LFANNTVGFYWVSILGCALFQLVDGLKKVIELAACWRNHVCLAIAKGYVVVLDEESE
jgi:hypothetical protein